ncbi:MAG: PAC2 family protein [Candidatus Bathyarchaeota archaeon]|nr:PAC2 family protein [Candidatus Bathyarchaeum tardum]WGM89618.1 MAG: PAC2 family protein [Candidatus Bathyarchaeum tardum]WNZ30280.1 MAG: PAC2 family protein [Candidatus Bathyarchaeota archaeon]
MKQTTIEEQKKVELKNPILIEGFPGLGMVGSIATKYLVKQLKAEKVGTLYSPHFPYHVIVSKKGGVRLLRGEFYVWKNESGKNDFIFLIGDSQAQTIEGQFEVANTILDFAEQKNVETIITIGGYRNEFEGDPKIVAVATNPELFEQAQKAKALPSEAGTPIVGTAGLLLGLAQFRNVHALCLLGETRGYLPDPKTAKSIIEVLQGFLNVTVDLTELDKEIEKAKEVLGRMQDIEKRRAKYMQNIRKVEEEKITYIS